MDGFNLNLQEMQGYIIEYGIAIISAIIIFIVGKWLARIISNFISKTLSRSKVDPMLVSFVGNISYALLMAFVVIATISKVGIETTSIAAIFAAAGLAIGLALQGSLSNFAAGVMIITFRPFKIGDYVEMAGTAGSINSIHIFTTTLKTPDNKTVIIPNSSVTSGNICNYSSEKTRRIDMVFGCGYGDDIKKAKEVLEKVVNGHKMVLKDPKPTIAVVELGSSSVDFVVRPWVKTEDYWTTRFEITEGVKLAFDKEGISIPFPQQDVHIHQVEAKPKKKK